MLIFLPDNDSDKIDFSKFLKGLNQDYLACFLYYSIHDPINYPFSMLLHDVFQSTNDWRKCQMGYPGS